MVNQTSLIRIPEKIKKQLCQQKVHPRETFGDIIERLLEDRNDK